MLRIVRRFDPLVIDLRRYSCVKDAVSTDSCLDFVYTVARLNDHGKALDSNDHRRSFTRVGISETCFRKYQHARHQQTSDLERADSVDQLLGEANTAKIMSHHEFSWLGSNGHVS